MFDKGWQASQAAYGWMSLATSLMLALGVGQTAWSQSASISQTPLDEDAAEDVRVGRQLAAGLAAGPRLFANVERFAEMRRLIGNVPDDSCQSRLAAWILTAAQRDLEAAPLERKLQGIRLLSISREALARIMRLAFAFRVTDDPRYLHAAERQMDAVAAFADWNPSHFLDVAEMTLAVAIGVDWLGDDLSEATRKRSIDAIVQLGLQASYESTAWQRLDNNWNPVCHAGLTCGALVVADQQPELAERVIRRAIASVPRAMGVYAPDGGYPEGPGYWAYGTTFNVLLIDVLEANFGTDFGLTRRPGFLQTPEYFVHVVAPSGKWFNYSDCGAEGPPSEAMAWFARRNANAHLLQHERAKVTRWLDRKPDRLAPLLLLWGAPLWDESTADAAQVASGGGQTGGFGASTDLHFSCRGDVPIAVDRTSWSPDAAFLAIKGGSAATNHAHMDAGSFVYEALGVRWACDLGNQDYHSLESRGVKLWGRAQDSQRWSVFRLGSSSHNVFTVDGQQQRVGGKATLRRTASGVTEIELKSVYAGQLAAARRTARLADSGEATLSDEVCAGQRAARITWSMITDANQVGANGGGASVDFERGGRRLRVQATTPRPVVWTLTPLDPPP
ncbi:MAG: heparinase II/III family protein, partial [Planctomycetales bacterium]|nr:heparinase II/III family protein [Planctomycetales bacterium]